jgi:hypothetical protein
MGFNSMFKGLKIERLIFCPKTQIVSEFLSFTTVLYSSLYVTHQHVNFYILLMAMFYMDKMFICTAQLVNKKIMQTTQGRNGRSEMQALL